jgi:hypothetical protein
MTSTTMSIKKELSEMNTKELAFSEHTAEQECYTKYNDAIKNLEEKKKATLTEIRRRHRRARKQFQATATENPLWGPNVHELRVMSVQETAAWSKKCNEWHEKYAFGSCFRGRSLAKGESDDES